MMKGWFFLESKSKERSWVPTSNTKMKFLRAWKNWWKSTVRIWWRKLLSRMKKCLKPTWRRARLQMWKPWKNASARALWASALSLSSVEPPSRTRAFSHCWMLFATICLLLWICPPPRARTPRTRRRIWCVRPLPMRSSQVWPSR